MRAGLFALVGFLAITGTAACGTKDQVCHRYQVTCTASCLDGSTPRFTAETDACWFESVSPVGTDSEAWFCDSSAAPSVAASHCPAQAPASGSSDCTSCGAWTLGSECACPTLGNGHF